MHRGLLIHHNNIVNTKKFDTHIFFDSRGQVDTYIQTSILPKLQKTDFDIIFIKDNLSSNYLELYGITLAYHIRLSKELNDDKRFVPIVIISDVDACVLNKLDTRSNILFTENVFFVSNQEEEISIFFEKNKEYKKKIDEKRFLSSITVESPKETSHDIANEWAIYRWATLLDVKTDATMENENSIKSMLYFKYLLALNHIGKVKSLGYKRPKTSGKILYIDDEWEKGWKDILEAYLGSTGIELATYQEDFTDANTFSLRRGIKEKVKSYDPDIVLLDLRLVSNDHSDTNRDNLDNYTGIQVRQEISEVNPGIQVIMFTATSKSLILEKMYEHNILGYIKKEHPQDKSLNTKDNIGKLAGLIDNGMNKKYLKNIWNIQQSILLLDIFQEEKFKPMEFEIKSIFELLDSGMAKRYTYAMLSIFQTLEEINNYYIDDKKAIWLDSRNSINVKTSTKNKILEILHQKLKLYNLDKEINEISHLRNNVIHPNGRGVSINSEQIVEWFKMLQTILEKIKK